MFSCVHQQSPKIPLRMAGWTKIRRAALDYLRNPGHWSRNITWRLPQAPSNSPVVFLVGAPRSGTTLLQRILSSHPDLFSIEGETAVFTLQNLFIRSHFNFSRSELDRLLEASSGLVDFYDRCLARLQEDNPGRRFVDKTPQHVLRLRFLLRHFPKAQFVHIIRDGRDCYLSSRAHPNIPQNRSPEAFARYWSRCLSAWRSVAHLPNTYQLTYEDFAHEPEPTLRPLMAFLGLEFYPRQLSVETISNDARAARPAFKRLNQPISPATCGRWRREMDDRALRRFNRIAGITLAEAGYPT